MKILLSIIFNVLIIANSYSQEISGLNCDSLFSEFEVIEPKYHSVWKMTEFKGNMDSVRHNFYQEVKSQLPKQKEYKLLIGAMVDTLGNVICAKTYLGINDIIDSLALETVRNFKFTPAEIKHKKIQIREMILLMNRKCQ
ncbi:MAG: hypothetical protein MUP85_01405 [Candidatus Lokiarchaeota archaeon]|nr:hypothetical protein [Candidatus Lokiarchaeota archaeon]